MAGLFFSYYNIEMQTVDLNVLNLFPTIVGCGSNLALANKVLPYAKEVLADLNNHSGIWGYVNTFKKPFIKTDVFNELESFIRDVSSTYLTYLKLDNKINDINMFFSVMNQNDFHGRHTHPGSKVSGVFYLNADEMSSCIRFHDSRAHAEIISYGNKSSSLMDTSFDIAPTPGMFLIFPSWVPHSVVQSNLNSNRITAVFNVA
jgi:uncharacterized protein (TIGR02466 family)